MAKKLNWIVPVIAVVAVLFVILTIKLIAFGSKKGSLHLECQKTIELQIDGNSYGTGSVFDVKLSAGSYQYLGVISGQADQKMTLEGTFSIENDQTTNVNCGADPEIEFISEPEGAKVSILAYQAPELGKTPVKATLPPGTYSFVFNLSGKAIEKGPIEIKFDDKKKVQVFFDGQPKSQTDKGDSMVIDSTPEGLMIYDDGKLAGITPVSFDKFTRLVIKDDGQTLEIPKVFTKQFVWIHPEGNLFMAISSNPIEFSKHQWFAQGGFFSSFVEDGFIKINLNGAHPIQTKLPAHDWTVGYTSRGSQLVWAGVKGSSLLLEAFDQMTGRREEIKQRDQLIYLFAKQIQSPTGNMTRFFGLHGDHLFEFDIVDMKALDLGKAFPGAILRRMGETSDFGVGLMMADGKCAGILGRRYRWQPEQPMSVGFCKSAQPPIMAFFSGSKVLGINTDSGSVEWQTNLAEEPLQIVWNDNEQVWIAESLDSSRYYMISQNDGQVIPLDKGSTMAQENPKPGYIIAGYYTGNDGYIQLSIKPGSELSASSNGQVIWTVPCEAVYSTKAFNPLADIGKVYLTKAGSFYNIDLVSGNPTKIDAHPIEFYEAGAVVCDKGVWSGKDRIFYGSCNVAFAGNSLKISLSDGSSCVILP
ncbi:MAG: hypothetical protein HGA95_00950 [Caldiserica bacterium]|nr:hypothetical protein [Caldisericota bacterium]